MTLLNQEIIEKMFESLPQLPPCPPAPKKRKIQLYCYEKIQWDFLPKQNN